jgi:hypothetical protein
MAAPMNSTQFKDIVSPILNVEFDGVYDMGKNQYKEVFDEIKGIERNQHLEPVLSGFGAAPLLPDGMAVNYDSGQELYMAKYFYAVYGLAFALTLVMYEDGDHIDLGKIYSQHLANSMLETKETNGANILNRAFSGTYPGGDGVSLSNANHVGANGFTYSNVLATAAALSQTSLEQLLIQIKQATDDNGKKINLTPQKLIVAPSNMFQAQVLLKSALRTSTANNDINPIQTSKLQAEPSVLTRLTSNTAWWVKTDAPKGLQLAMRRKLTKTMEGDFETDSMRYKATERYAFGWTNPRTVFGTQGA